jgi:ABC-2 type transport system permease protein
MWAIALKEFRQLRRDRRTLALMIFLPLVLLVVFGYAASFDVSEVPTIVVGPGANTIASHLPSVLDVQAERPDEGRADAEDILRGGEAVVVVVADPRAPEVFVDGSELFSARAVVTGLAGAGTPLPAGIPKPKVRVLFNPGLETSAVMVPAIIGLILVFVGTVATSLGVVRERQAGTLEQLAVMPFRARDVFVGKVAPYFAVGILDMAIVVAAGLGLFGVPFRGSVLTFALGALLFLFVTLGIGVLISTVSENQGQAIQLAIMTLLPQVLLSGMVFPLQSMAAGVRWIAYVLPLTYFIRISRGVMVRGAPLASLWFPLAMLAVLGLVVFGLSVNRFRRDLAPAGREHGAVRAEPGATAGART